jgi:hypothetical protein
MVARPKLGPSQNILGVEKFESSYLVSMGTTIGSSVKSIAVVCAKPNRNPGMQSVDLAFHAISSELRDRAEATFFCLPHPSELVPGWNRYGSQLPFQYVDGFGCLDRILDSDVILYWGDFLHADYYHRLITRILLNLRKVRSEAEGLKMCRKFFLLKECGDDVFAKVISFGTTILSNSQRDYQDSDYLHSLERFSRRARRIWMRDSISALKINHVRAEYKTNHLGVDCSLVMSERDWATSLEVAAKEKPSKLGVFFGRTSISRDQSEALVEALTHRLKVPAEWIPWLDSSPMRHATLLPQIASSEAFNVDEVLSSLKDYALVITDTYHLSLNSWKWGTPAVCVGECDAYRKSSLSEKKKEIFYAMYDAMDFYVSLEEWSNPSYRASIVCRLENALNSAFVSTIHRRILVHAQTVRAELLASIRELVG